MPPCHCPHTGGRCLWDQPRGRGNRPRCPGTPVERATAVFRHERVLGQLIDAVRMVGIDPDVTVVKRPRIRAVHVGPGCAAILGTVEPAAQLAQVRIVGAVLLGLEGVLDHDHQDSRIGAGYVHLDLAEVSGGQAAGELGPGLSAIGALEEAAVRPAAQEPVRQADPLPEAGVEHIGVGGVHGDVAGARLAVVGQAAGEARPGTAAVRGAEDAALARVAPQVALRRDIHDVGIGRVHQHLADVVRIPEPHVGEGAPAIRGLVDPVAPADAVAGARLARAHPDHVGVGLEDVYVAHVGGAVALEDALPGDAAVRRLEDAAGSRGDIHHGRFRLDGFNVGDAADHVGRSDRAPLKRLE